MEWVALILGGGGAILAFLVVATAVAYVIARFYRKVDQGQALIINKMSAEPEVTFTGGVVYPIIHRAEVMDISVKSIVVARSGKEGLICADNIRADIKVAFFVRVNKTKEDVLKVAQSIGCDRASKQETLEELFAAKFSEALKTVGKQLQFEDLYTRRDDFKDRIIEVIGRDLNGYALEDVAIDYLEQTPIEALDKDNVLDSQGIRKITQITAVQNIATNDLRQNEKKELTRQNLEADEAILELERRRADAEARQRREIETVKAREAAETAKIQAEERQRQELARIKADEEIEIGEINKARQLLTADKDKDRVLAIKTEQVERDRELEEIARKREVERQEIDKEMELEVKRKEIADVVRSRIVVDKNVAEEEERIKDLRAHATAERQKQVLVIGAQAEAEEQLVKSIKAAEAAEKVAEHEARKRLTIANAELESADRVAKAKIRVAEGVQAESAAKGLAEVKVKEANAVAVEKEGLAQARVELERYQARAKGEEEQGLARTRVKEREVEVAARQGDVDAEVLRKRMEAEATGKVADAEAVQKRGAAEAEATRLRMLAEAEGRKAEAAAIEARGLADAKALEEKMAAEARGLQAKLEAMQAMDGAAREHEEFRLKLEVEQKLRLGMLEAQKEVAAAQAKVLAEAFGKADIKIMGGDGQFLDKFVQAASVGNMMDAFLANSQTATALLTPFVTGERSVGEAVRDVIEAVKPNGSDGKALASPDALEEALKKADGQQRDRLAALLRTKDAPES
ncbi:MAG: hypothetical protein H6738_08830 [Alphaproteobacteria bacterium]|nr:hypothetical protein [Alphaproteobacteria bacterium]MCB9696865.1 hypothetical protein [Alphaproteobacteria bacterium]